MMHSSLLALCGLSLWLAAASSLATPAAGHDGLAAWGSVMRVRHSGQAPGQVRLADLPQKGTWGVGALADLQGEVLLYDGRVLVSRGSDTQGRTSPPAAADQAALFAAATVAAWTDIQVPADMEQPAFEAFVKEQATARGLDTNAPFAFRVRGRYPQITWHVVTGMMSHGTPQGGSPGAGMHPLVPGHMHTFDQKSASGHLVGIYSGARLEGVVSHPGERFHVHYADDALAVSGHVDRYAVGRGAVLQLPSR
jgi:alpha-acetolactate decarboxylase